MTNGQKGVDYDIRNARHKMLIYVYVVLFEFLVEIFLKFVKAQSISLFGCAIVV